MKTRHLPAVGDRYRRERKGSNLLACLVCTFVFGLSSVACSNQSKPKEIGFNIESLWYKDEKAVLALLGEPTQRVNNKFQPNKYSAKGFERLELTFDNRKGMRSIKVVLQGPLEGKLTACNFHALVPNEIKSEDIIGLFGFQAKIWDSGTLGRGGCPWGSWETKGINFANTTPKLPRLYRFLISKITKPAEVEGVRAAIGDRVFEVLGFPDE